MRWTQQAALNRFRVCTTMSNAFSSKVWCQCRARPPRAGTQVSNMLPTEYLGLFLGLMDVAKHAVCYRTTRGVEVSVHDNSWCGGFCGRPKGLARSL